MMREPSAVDPGAWIAAVGHLLAGSAAQPVLAATGIDRVTLLAVARAEASGAGADGVTRLSHAQLAEAVGVPRAAVLRARLALIELGLEHLAAAPGAPGTVDRVLRHPSTWPAASGGLDLVPRDKV